MNRSIRRYIAGVTIACLVLGCGLRVLADPPPAPGVLLTQAYTALASADHDYKGHRIRAMRQVKAAAVALGVSLGGDGRNREAQGASDAQLQTAQGLLQQARAGLSGKPLRHVNQAIKQISIALSIR
jgi:hypothetical protein